MATKGLLDQLGDYMVTRQRMKDALPSELNSIGALGFDVADRIIYDAISQAQCALHAVVSAAEKSAEIHKQNKIPVLSMGEVKQER